MHDQSRLFSAPVLTLAAVIFSVSAMIAEFAVRSDHQEGIVRMISSDDESEIDRSAEEDVSAEHHNELIAIVQNTSLAPLTSESLRMTTFFRNIDPSQRAELQAYVGRLLAKRKRHEEALAVLAGLSPEERIEHGSSFSFAQSYRGAGNVEAAINAYAIHVAANPNHNPGYVNYGILLAETGQHEEAIRVFERSVDITSSSRKGKSLSLLGQSQMAIAAHEDAIESFDKSIQYRPDSGPTWRRFASAKARAGTYPQEEVEADYQRALALAPGSAVTMKEWAEYNFAFGRFEAALPLFRNASSEASNNFDVLFSRSLNLLVSERPRAARTVVRKISNVEKSTQQELLLQALHEVSGIVRPPTIETRDQTCAAQGDDERFTYLCAMLQLATEAPEAAIETAAKLPETSIYKQPAIFALARYEYRYDQADAALVRLDELLEKSPQSSLFWLYKARVQTVLGANEGALAAFEESLELNPESRKITLEMTDHLMAMESYDQAEAALLAFMQQRPNDASVLIALARNYAAAGNPEKAEETLLQLMSMSEEADPETTEQLVAVQMLLEKYPEALANADNLLERDPANISARRMRVQALTELGRDDEAEEELDRIKRLEPEASGDDAPGTDFASAAP
ncbi:MAG: tetratricopeptide repeat protein [Henriciella sp.]|nr:tetratricopeptide repeat protein [Henriciella sp.]